MHYISGVLFHQNIFFPITFIGPNVFFPWLLLFSYLTDVFVHVLFTSSSSLTYTSSMLLFECFFFYFFLVALLLLPHSTVTIFVWRSTFVFISLLHASIINIIAEWFITIASSATTYSIAISMIVIHIRVLMQFILKRKKNPPEVFCENRRS